jgi:hypothetical protein
MNRRSRFFHAPGLDELRERIEPGEIILAPYILALAWQYFRLVGNGPLAWTLTAVFSAIAWLAYLKFKEGVAVRVPRAFWWLVALPLLLIYALRVAIPDISFDVLNYHIFHAERALRGPLFIAGDYFPTPAPFNPTPDILTGLYRYLLGYRLGTIANYLALIWTGTILNRLLRDYIAAGWIRCAGILIILLTEQILFQVNNYMIDLLALPLLLEATRLAIDRIDPGNETRRIVLVASLLGASAAFKLTNLMFGAPIVLVLAFNLLSRSDQGPIRDQVRRLWKVVLVSAAVFVVPLAPFTIYLYRITGSPVFPLYNAIFGSPYWPHNNVLDPRWGAAGPGETLFWPVLVFFKPERFCEFPVYSGRLLIGFSVTVACLVLARKDQKIRGLCFITLAGLLLWSASSGYSRYAIYLELTSGVIVIWSWLYIRKRSAFLSRPVRFLAQAPLAILILAQIGLAFNYARQYEWSMRETIFNIPTRRLVQESKEFFRDRSLSSYLSPDDRALIDRVEVWVETTYKTSALEALLKPEIPVIGVRMPEYFASDPARQKFAQALRATQGKRVFTLTDAPNLQAARQALAARGLSAGQVNPITIPYFSPSLKFDMLLVEVLATGSSQAGQPVAKGLPLPDDAFKASLALAKALPVLQSGQKYEIRVILMNASQVTWPGRQPGWQYQITIGNRWLTANGSKVNDLDGRAALFDDLGPAEKVELTLTITAPQQPGAYILQIDSVQEGVAWFGDRGSEVLSLKVKVE